MISSVCFRQSGFTKIWVELSCVFHTVYCSSILLCSSSFVKTSLNSSISLTPLSVTSFTTLRSLISILNFLYSSKSHHLSPKYIRKRMSCKDTFSRWKMITDRSPTRSETQVSRISWEIEACPRLEGQLDFGHKIHVFDSFYEC